ncbi:MAG TPA: DUF222 domain-containing protein, partial [Actinophytocola sp.]|nr:DUF222 domain-containing protein [Actinophytocola sp.]
IERELRHGVEQTFANIHPSGFLALEMDADTRYPDRLSDAELIDAMVGAERLTAWAQARQARILAEFARRRPGDDTTMVNTDKPCSLSKFAPDEVGLALTQSRMTAKARIGRSVQLEQVLPETLHAWQQGRLDERRVTAICDATHYLPVEKARAVQQRVLDRAPQQTLAELKAALKRAVVRVDPEGAAERHRAARRDRRVVVGEEQEGMASLWALLTATDARSCFQWLTRLAQGCGKDDPRGMDARRADLMVGLLNGTLTNAPADDTTDGSGSSTGSDAGTDTDSASGSDADTARGHSTDSDTDAGSGRGSGSDSDGSDSDGSDSGDEAAESGDTAGAAGDAGGAGTGSGLLPRPVNPGKPLVQVLMPFTTLLGLDQQPCELVGHGPIPAELAREIAADANLKRLVYDPLTGTVLDHGRTTYRPPAGLADHVRARDVYCRGPICRRRVLDGHLDHIVPFPDGPTNEQNLHGCCGHDHRMKHAPGWSVRALPDGRIQWITPTGHRYHSHPHDYRDEPDLPPPRPVDLDGEPDDERDEQEPPRRWTQQDYDRVLTSRPAAPAPWAEDAPF